MTDQPNLQQFLDEMSSFSEDGASAAAAGRSRRRTLAADRPWSSKSPARARRSRMRRRSGSHALLDHADPSVAMSGQVGSQVKMMVGTELADRQRPHACAPATTARSSPTSTSSAKAARDADGQHDQFPPRRHPLPDPRLRGLSGHHRGPARDVRRRRQRRTSRSAPSIRPTTSAARSTSTRCCRSISRCWARPAPANRPRSR